jgi:hypothetical protein
MKLSFTEKLIYEQEEFKENLKTVQFTSYLKTDFIEKQIYFEIDGNRVHQIYFYTTNFGSARWENGKGFIEADAWEEEDTGPSFITKHYSVSIASSGVSEKFIFESIIPDVLNFLLDQKLANQIKKMIQKNHFKEKLNWAEIFYNYKLKTENFLLSRND